VESFFQFFYPAIHKRLKKNPVFDNVC